MPGKNHKLIFFCIATTCLINTVLAQKNRTIQIDSFLQQANRVDLFNGNILVADHNRMVYEKAFGYADASGKTKLTKDYRFNIGSIAKEFNAVGIMMLKEQGKLRLEDKVSTFLPELPAWAEKIRIINLLQYTSGLPDVKWKTIKSDADNLANLKTTDKLDFEPGSNYAYNNNNVFLQRKIIEKITGMTFNKFVEQQILKPCKMNTAIVDPTDSDPLIAKPFNNAHQQDSLVYPISGWTSVTLADFYKWSKCISTFQLIGPASTREILIPGFPNKQSGLGGGSMESDSIINHIHDGTSLNYQALLVCNVSAGRTVILMTNNKQNSLYALNTAIQAILDGRPYELPKKSILNVFQQQLDSMKGVQIVQFYENLKTTHSQEYGFNDPFTLNEIGYFLMGKKQLADAVIIFEYNTRLFPTSGNVFDSLGEAYYKQGDKSRALANYKKAFALDPTNKTAEAIVAELGP